MVGAAAMDDTLKRIGGKLKMLRLAQKKTQQEVADSVACGKTTYGDVERGKYLPNQRLLEAIATELGTTVGDLFADEKMVPEDFERYKCLQSILRTSEQLSMRTLYAIDSLLMAWRDVVENAYEQGKRAQAMALSQNGSSSSPEIFSKD